MSLQASASKGSEVVELESNSSESLEGYHRNSKGEAFVKSGLKAGIRNRQINLIALCGIIGPGCLIGMGGSLAQSGPVALVVGFTIIGVLVLSMMASVGEMNAVLDANFGVLGSRFISKGFGATLSLFYVIVWVTVLIAEYTNLTGSMQAYTDKVPQYGWVLIFWAFFSILSSLSVNWYGELEYVLGIIKLAFLTGYYIFAIVYAAGGIKGHKPDNPFGNYPLKDGFKGIANSFVYAATFYSGVESISIIAAEARNPRKAIPTAVKNTVIRIFFVYYGLAIAYGITVPYNDPLLTSNSKVLKSPMSIALIQAGWSNAPYFIASMILMTCLSSINSAIYISSRALFTWSQQGYGPKIFAKVNKKGVPYVAVHVVHLFCFLSIMSWKAGSAVAYSYIVNVSGVAAFIVWTAIVIIHVRFRNGWLKQGYKLDDLPFKSPLFPWSNIVSITIGVVLILVQGWTVFKPFEVGPFIDAYILLPLFFVFWAGYDYFFKGHILKYEEMDFETGRRPDLDDDVNVGSRDINVQVDDEEGIAKKTE
ncbi:DEKNAAC104600 [Brettanomyces naardenensis]|uniref:DEKNAAC104600 n=1 Tax=Brettanomyces naardenensis TaxID=13370 RepID=A0A448YRB7_BRENA|nr:DEKNAAC104600 [Brettanomyces naardenensis]